MKKIILFALLLCTGTFSYAEKTTAATQATQGSTVSFFSGKKKKVLASNSRRFVAVFLNGIIRFIFVSWLKSNPKINNGMILAGDVVIATILEVLGLWLVGGFGKSMVGIKIVDEKGEGLGMGRIILRTFCKNLLSPITWIPMLFNAEGKGIHDFIAKTNVVMVQPTSN